MKAAGTALQENMNYSAASLARRPDGIFVAPFEQGEIGPDPFRAACNIGLEGLVSKRADRPALGDRRTGSKSRTAHPAYRRVQDQL